MSNHLADFPPERFAIHAYCACGHDAQIDVERLSADPHNRCIAGAAKVRCLRWAGGVDQDRLDRSGWVQAFGWGDGLVRVQRGAVVKQSLMELSGFFTVNTG